MKTQINIKMKRLLGFVIWIFGIILSLVLIVFILLLLDSDYHTENELREVAAIPVKSKKEYSHEINPALSDSLLNEFGNNKTLPEGFEYATLLALSHYPELKDTPIDFQIKPAFLPLASRPAPLSVLFPWIRRKYLVVISNETVDFFEPILLENTPFNEQVGIIGHELAHTIYYLNKSSLQIAKIGFCYLFNDFAVKFEREADKIAISHGLGYQLYNFAFFVRKAFGQSRKEIESESGGRYLSPDEIAEEMEKYEFYQVTLDTADAYC